MLEVPDKFTASFFCSTDTESNQIASFYTGAMANAGELSFRGVDDCRLAIISPNDPGAMVQYAEECRTLGIPFIWDPGQQCARMSGPELQEGLEGSALVICNDYEFELMRQKTSIDEDSVLEHTARARRDPGRERVLDLHIGMAAGRPGGAARRGLSIRRASATRSGRDT